MRKLILFLAAVSLVLFAEKALCYETTFSIEPESFNSFRYQEMRAEEAAPLSIRRGRFLSVDPVLGTPALPQSWNRLTYAANKPLHLVDPDGRFPRNPMSDFKVLSVTYMMIKSGLANLKGKGTGVAGKGIRKLAAPAVKGWDYSSVGFNDAFEKNRNVASVTLQAKGLGIELSMDFDALERTTVSVLGLVFKKSVVGAGGDQISFGVGMGGALEGEIPIDVLADRLTELAAMKDSELIDEFIRSNPELDPLFEAIYGTDADKK